MAIYVYKCVGCDFGLEKIQNIGENATFCPKCGVKMMKQPTFPAMVKMKGEGGYPSRRKYVKGTAPYCGSAKAWNKGLRNDFNPDPNDEVNRS